MEPAIIQADGWDQLSRLMVYLFLFTGLGVTSGLSFLLAQAIIPSLTGTQDLAGGYRLVRWPLWLVMLLAAGLSVYALWSALDLATSFIASYYPRALI
jgi:hypothetical protein